MKVVNAHAAVVADTSYSRAKVGSAAITIVWAVLAANAATSTAATRRKRDRAGTR